FLVTAALFLVTLVVPDPLPLVDELLLGMGTLLLAGRKRRGPRGPAADGRAPIEGQARRERCAMITPVDAHFQLDADEFDRDRDAVVARARDAGVHAQPVPPTP